MTLLQTKLHPPNLHAAYQARPQLLTRLNQGLAGKLTLVIAPAGSGKTTLLTAWAMTNPAIIAWVSLSEQDNNPTSFWHLLAAALQQVMPPDSDLPPLDSPIFQQSPRQIPSLYLNILNQLESPIYFILDDYHLTNHPHIQQDMTTFIEHLPPSHHLMLSCRHSPNLPLSRWRVRRQLHEINAADLNFTQLEVAIFLQKNLPDYISPEIIDTLHKRTEGWIAGLVMATLACQHKSHPNQWLKTFSGTHHHLANYFLSEVFQQQKAESQAFLMQTSILRQLHADSCRAVTQIEYADRQLRQMAHANLLLIPLDDAHTWYRYHPLFADWLQQQLQRNYSRPKIEAMHQRASQWFANHKMFDEAIHHAFTSNNLSQAAQLLNEIALISLWDRNHYVVLKKLPKTEIESRPRLCLIAAWWHAEKGNTYLNLAESQLRPDDPEYNRMQGLIAARRAMLLRLQGEHQAAEKLAKTALTMLPDIALPEQQVVQQNLAIIYFTTLQLDKAYTLLSQLYATSQRQKDMMTQISTAYFLAKIEILYGRLPAAQQRCLQILDSNNFADPMLGLLNICLGNIYLAWNKLENANSQFAQALAFGEQIQMIEIIKPALSGQMAVYHALGQMDNAQFNYSRLQQIEAEVSLPLVKARISLTLTEFALATNDGATVASWIQKNKYTLSDRPNPAQVQSYLLLANMHIRQRLLGKTSVGTPEIISLLNHLLSLSRQAKCVDYQIKIHLAKSLAYHSSCDFEAAQTSLRLAQNLAKQGNYQRVFLDYQLPTFPLPDPLTLREQEVLSLVEQGFSTRAIATQLSLTVGTVKWHLGNVYQKLGVRSRTQAISRARSFGIL